MRITALLAGALLLLAACSGSEDNGEGGNGARSGGDGGGGTSAAALVLSSALATQDEGTARVALRIETAAPGLPDGFAVTARGVVDFKGGKGRLVSLLPNVFGEDQANAAPQSIVTVYDESVLYLKADFISQIVPGGRPWLRVDESRSAGSLGPLSQLAQLGQSDPLAAFGLLQGLTGPVTTIEEDVDVRGTPTTHYRFTVHVAKALRKVGGASRAQVEALAKQGVDTVPTDAWLDDQGAVRRMRYLLEIRPQGGSRAAKAKVTVTMDLFEFGTPVDIEPPHADQVTDIGKLVGQGAGGE